jgi:hypothetical protein
MGAGGGCRYVTLDLRSQHPCVVWGEANVRSPLGAVNTVGSGVK